MSPPVAEIVDLTDAALTRLRRLPRGRPRPRRAEGRREGRRGAGRLLRPRRRGRNRRPPRALARSPAPLFPREKEAAGARPRRRGPHRRDRALARRERPRGPVPPELHAHGPGPPPRDRPPRRLPGSRALLREDVHARAQRMLSRRPRRDRAPLRRPRGRDRGLAQRPRPRAARRLLLGRDRQQRRLPRDAPRPPEARDEPGEAEGLHALVRRRARSRRRTGSSTRVAWVSSSRASRWTRRRWTLRGGPGDRDYKPLDVESATMAITLPEEHRPLPGLEVPPGWGRRRREPEGLPDRGEPRADHSAAS